MFRNIGLRARIVAGFVTVSLLTAIGFSLGAFWAADTMEAIVLEQNIGETAKRISKSIAGGDIPQLPGEDWYFARFQSDGDIEVEFDQLQNGPHDEMLVNGKEFHIWVEPLKNDRLYLFYDQSKIEAYESQLVMFLVAMSLILITLSFAFSTWLTTWVAKPLSLLANRVEQLPRDASSLGFSKYTDPDLTVIVTAIETYLNENHEFVERERAFTGMASHELRTPVATISASLDLLLETTDSIAASGPLGRIKRANDRMAKLIEVLLELARSQENDSDEHFQCYPGKVINEVASILVNQSASTGKHMSFDLDDGFSLDVKPVLFDVVARNLISNALEHSTGPEIQVELTTFHFKVNSHGITNSEPIEGKLGLSIVEVICNRLHWTFNYAHQPNGSFSATVEFRSSFQE